MIRNKEYSTRDIDSILSNKRTNKSVLANRRAILAALTEDEKRIARAYMYNIRRDKREAVEFAKDAINNGDALLYDGMTFVDVVEEWVEQGLFSQSTLENYTTINYEALARDIEPNYAVYEDDDGTVVIYN